MWHHRKAIRIFISLIILLFAFPAFAAITFTDGEWATSFDYSEFCTQRGGGGETDCDTINNDGTQWAWGASAIDGNYSQSTTAAKNPLSSGRQGARFWVGDGTNSNSGPIGVVFPAKQQELWIRWYMRYQEGFNWTTIYYDKTLYIRASPTDVIPLFYYDEFTVGAQGGDNTYQVITSGGHGWPYVMGGQYSDGQFHCFEIHIKMDTDGTNGIGRLWIDGILLAENTGVNWSFGSTVSREGWTHFDFHNNQSGVDNTNGPIGLPLAYVDFDDIAVYNTTPTNTDADGNAMIGPLDWAPTSMSGVTVRGGSVQ